MHCGPTSKAPWPRRRLGANQQPDVPGGAGSDPPAAGLGKKEACTPLPAGTVPVGIGVGDRPPRGLARRPVGTNRARRVVRTHPKDDLITLPATPSNSAASFPAHSPLGRKGNAHSRSPATAVPKTSRKPVTLGFAGDGGEHPARPSGPKPGGGGVVAAGRTRTETRGRAPGSGFGTSELTTRMSQRPGNVKRNVPCQRLPWDFATRTRNVFPAGEVASTRNG
jgi:hypothetical protein